MNGIVASKDNDTTPSKLVPYALSPNYSTIDFYIISKKNTPMVPEKVPTSYWNANTNPCCSGFELFYSIVTYGACQVSTIKYVIPYKVIDNQKLS